MVAKKKRKPVKRLAPRGHRLTQGARSRARRDADFWMPTKPPPP